MGWGYRHEGWDLDVGVVLVILACKLLLVLTDLMLEVIKNMSCGVTSMW